MTYRADVDGLRAVAVLSVVAFHYGFALLGGFTGVDVFFVISGFVITATLHREVTEDRFSILNFYVRRARRILPALFATLLIVNIAGYFFLMPGDYASLGDSTKYAAVGLSNLFFYMHTGYFDQTADLLPLLHTWSLGVEEQFYVAWPCLLFGLCIFARKRGQIALAIAALIIVSFTSSLIMLGHDPKAAFYNPFTRAWELALGALPVFTPKLNHRSAAEGANIGGLALIVAGFLLVSPTQPFPGWNALLPCLGAALIVWPKEATFSATAFSKLNKIGLISYSLYLWHWPIFVFYRVYINGDHPSPMEALALIVLAVAVSALSYKFIETPLRRAPISRPAVFRLSAASVSGLLFVGAVVTSADGFPARIPHEVYEMRSRDAMWAWECPRELKLDALNFTYCEFGVPWEHATTKAILWGDSHAEHMAPIIEAAAKDSPSAFLLYRTCSAALGGHVRWVRSDLPTYAADCAAFRQRAIQLLNSDKSINLVILSSSWAYLPSLISQDGALDGKLSQIDLVREGIRDLIDGTATRGRRFIVIADVPQYDSVDPTPCALSAALKLFRRQCSPQQYLISREDFEKFERSMYKALTSLNRPDTTVVLPGDALCASDPCQSYLDGEFLYRDGGHIRRNLADQTKRDYADLIGLTAALERASITGTRTAEGH